MPVIALMRCDGIDTFLVTYNSKPEVGGLIKLGAIYTEDESMREYADATPSGSLELNIQNPAAMKQFTPGKYYKITIEETEA